MLSLDRAGICAITNWTESNIRHMQAHRYTPWDESEIPSGSHRRYDGSHGLCLTVAELLVAQNMPVRAACKLVNEQIGTVNTFLDRAEQGELAETLFVAHVGYIEEDDALPGVMTPISLSGIGDGTAAALLSAISQVLTNEIGVSRSSRAGKSITRGIAGPFLVAVPIQEAYSLLTQRAVAAGLNIFGRTVRAIDSIEH